MRQIYVYPGDDGYWVAECPSLPGCVSQGKSREDAINNIKEAIKTYVSVLKEDKLRVPREACDAMPIVAWMVWIVFVLVLVLGLLFSLPGQIILLSIILNAA